MTNSLSRCVSCTVLLTRGTANPGCAPQVFGFWTGTRKSAHHKGGGATRGRTQGLVANAEKGEGEEPELAGRTGENAAENGEAHTAKGKNSPKVLLTELGGHTILRVRQQLPS